MDGDRLRRGAPTVWVLHGVAQAITAGDALFYLAAEALHRAPLRPEVLLRAHRHQAACLRRVAYGQGLETVLRRDGILPDLTSWREIARGKTGGLFAHGMFLGGLTASVHEGALSDLDELGARVGEIFQLQDDLLDLCGDKGRVTTGNDLWEGKPSWLIAECAGRLHGKARADVAKVLYRPRAQKTDDDVAWLRRVIEDEAALDRGITRLNGARAELAEWARRRLPLLEGLIEELADCVSGPLARRSPSAPAPAASAPRVILHGDAA